MKLKHLTGYFHRCYGFKICSFAVKSIFDRYHHNFLCGDVCRWWTPWKR